MSFRSLVSLSYSAANPGGRRAAQSEVLDEPAQRLRFLVAAPGTSQDRRHMLLSQSLQVGRRSEAQEVIDPGAPVIKAQKAGQVDDGSLAVGERHPLHLLRTTETLEGTVVDAPQPDVSHDAQILDQHSEQHRQRPKRVGDIEHQLVAVAPWVQPTMTRSSGPQSAHWRWRVAVWTNRTDCPYQRVSSP
jgi:hypothetical protein